MQKYHRSTYVCLLAICCVTPYLRVKAIPLGSDEGSDLFTLGKSYEPVSASQAETVDVSYQNDEEFKREIQEKLDELNKNKGVLFDRILLVNKIHKRWRNKYELKKRNILPNAEDLIIENNLENDDVYFEGDIILDETDKELLNGTTDHIQIRRKRNAIYERKKIWTSRQVPYVIDPSLSYDVARMIAQAIAITHQKTCVRWVKYNSLVHANYVRFLKEQGCFSKIGKAYAQRGEQMLSIGEGCEWLPTVLHEMTHAMGFFHEQSRDDRDRYIKIIWENIDIAFQDQFKKYSHGDIDKMGIEYDYNSLMHYSSTAFGNGKVTIQPIDPTKTIGNAQTYTALDVLEINTLYDCKTSSNGQSFSSWSPWSECDKSCYKERQRFCFHRDKTYCPKSSVYGIQSEQIKCAATECPAPINGNWGHWAAWSACTKSCDEGKRQRYRKCDKPTPSHNGKFCIGESIDISVCLSRRCNIGPYDVDFEDGWGIWFSNQNSKLNWWTHTGPVKTLNTGPLGDHTLQGNGNYIYVESSRPRVKGDSARLVSKALEFSNPQCLSFYYTMHGAMMGSLTLWLAPTKGGNWMNKFSKSGNQGTAWLSGDVTLDYKGKFQLIFEATLGGTGYSDIALDDIFIDNGACPGDVAPTIEPCTDDDRYRNKCKSWAVNGECTKTQEFMLQYCKKSCGKCEGCRDEKVECLNWAAGGECQKNPAFMKVECKASCGLCGDCKDNYAKNKVNCGIWAKNGSCPKYAAFMMKECKKTCTGCSGPCNDNNTECARWAKEKECEKNPSWMGTNCKKSCGKC